MAKAGCCSECGANVWLEDDGRCPAGHGAECISAAYDAEPPAGDREESAPTAPRSRRTAVLLIAIVAVVVIGVGVAGYLLYDALFGPDPRVEAAADFQTVMFEGDWERMEELCTDEVWAASGEASARG